MRPFEYVRAADAASGVAAVASVPGAKFLAGGSNLVDLMKEDIERPTRLVDIRQLPLRQIQRSRAGLSLGALATNTETANHPLIRENYPLLTQAIVAGASGQLRNMATNGGNLLQRTRCNYFYDTATPCNKREPGTGCGAREGLNKIHAVLGWSEDCVATYPGDMANALYALDANVRVRATDGRERLIPIADFHRLPGNTPQRDNNLEHGELIPWNAPMISMWWIIGGALATGCTAVIKTAEDASLTTLRTAELLMEAGVPPGVINVVTGLGAEAGAALAAHMDVDRIAFTGSTLTGREIIKASAGNMKRIQLELGGKSPDIVFADADLDKAVPGAAMGVFSNSGQICSAGTRIFVQRDIREEFVAKLVEHTRTIRIGDPFDPASQLGPLVSRRQMERVLEYMAIGRDEGARLATGGTRLGGDLSDGFYVAPTVFDMVDNQMRIAREEIFGPVAVVIPFDTVEEAIELGNDTNYGLGGGVWTTNVGTMMKAIHAIRAGKMWINCYGLADPAVGFSGTKQSGYGMKGGAQHIDGFLYEKSVYINGN